MKTKLIGAAIDACAGTKGSADTPELLHNSEIEFEKIIRYTNPLRNDIPKLQEYFTDLATVVKASIDNNELPIIIGGDHSCAIGTWSGIAAALGKSNQTLGLIWFDAHMDSHTPDTSLSGNIHGMPVATLLGHGYPELTKILTNNPKLLPQNIILIGIRSYEEGEEQLLSKLGVKVYYNYNVEKLGIAKVIEEAWGYLSKSVDKIGLSIDLDGFDPVFAPGVGTPEKDGINFDEFIQKFSDFDFGGKLIGVEITEGNFHFDQTSKTRDCIINIINTITLDKSKL